MEQVNDSQIPVDQGTPDSNIAWNRYRWGSKVNWTGKDNYGYQWGGGYKQLNSEATRVSDLFLVPYIKSRYDLKIMELSPGGGRFTAELIRFSRELVLLDMNQACIDICKERFKYYPNVRYFTNDGISCQMIKENDFDLIASFDSMVHMHPGIIQKYVEQFSKMIKSGGLIWLDHSGRGECKNGHRTDMTDQKIAMIASQNGLNIIAQIFRNNHDCITIMQSK